MPSADEFYFEVASPTGPLPVHLNGRIAVSFTSLDGMQAVVLRDDGLVALAEGRPGERIIGFALMGGQPQPLTRFERDLGADWGT